MEVELCRALDKWVETGRVQMQRVFQVRVQIRTSFREPVETGRIQMERAFREWVETGQIQKRMVCFGLHPPEEDALNICLRGAIENS